LLVTGNVLPSSSILDTLMMEAIRSSETSVLNRATRRHFPEDGILHSHRLENLKYYIELTGYIEEVCNIDLSERQNLLVNEPIPFGRSGACGSAVG
jgi:hypothetical protein